MNEVLMDIASILTFIFQIVGLAFVVFMIIGFFALKKENKEKEINQTTKPILDLKKATENNQVRVGENKPTTQNNKNTENKNIPLIDKKLIDLLSKPVPKREERKNLERKNSEMLIKDINNMFVLVYINPKTNEDLIQMDSFINSINFGFDIVVKLKTTAPIITIKHSNFNQNLILAEGLTIGQVESYLDDYLIEQFGLIV